MAEQDPDLTPLRRPLTAVTVCWVLRVQVVVVATRFLLSLVRDDRTSTGRAEAVRYSTLEAMCRVLGCQPGDLLGCVPTRAPRASGRTTWVTAGMIDRSSDLEQA